MKKYIAPEMEIVNFKAVDILTVSGEDITPTPTQITGNASATLYADSNGVTFSNNGGF